MGKKDKEENEENYPDFVWQDRDLRFDSREGLLACRKGEKIIDSINSVEDTKGNNGERGSLIVTNLRIIWVSHKNTKINLSIGYNTLVSVNIRKAKSKLRGDTQALCLIAKFGSKFEFVFTSLVMNSPRLFSTVQAVVKAYDSSKLYRDLKLRGSVVQDNELILLPLEDVYSKTAGVWNLSSEQGNLGTFVLTNVRMVWFATLAPNFNVSVPYMQIKAVKLRESKFGRALVVETFSRAGGYILGFRVDPLEKLEPIFREFQKMHSLFSSTPIFGVEFTIEATTTTTATTNIDSVIQQSEQQQQTPAVNEDVELTDDYEDSHVLAAYYADGVDGEEDDNNNNDHIQFDNQVLGLAVERMQDGLTMESLWRIL